MMKNNAPNNNNQVHRDLTLDSLNERLTALEQLCQPLFIRLQKPKRISKEALLSAKIEELIKKESKRDSKGR